MTPAGGLQHPDVHVVAQLLRDHVVDGHPVPPVAPGIGGGSVNMHLLVAAQNYAADPESGRQALLDILDGMERDGLFVVGGGCEQGTADPHVELSLNALSVAFLLAVRGQDAPAIDRLQRFFAGLYAYGLAISTPNGWVIGPGARMGKFGPRSVVLDAAVGVIGGKVTKFPFHHLSPDTVSPWCLLQVLEKSPALFDGVRGWTTADAEAHLPVLRWPLTVERFTGGHVASIAVPDADAHLMGVVGSGGAGCDKVWVSYSRSSSALGWRAYGQERWFGAGESAGILGNRLV